MLFRPALDTSASSIDGPIAGIGPAFAGLHLQIGGKGVFRLGEHGLQFDFAELDFQLVERPSSVPGSFPDWVGFGELEQHSEIFGPSPVP